MIISQTALFPLASYGRGHDTKVVPTIYTGAHARDNFSENDRSRMELRGVIWFLEPFELCCP
jgi:hypothetical protein